MAAAAIVAAITLLNPNDYKPQLEQLVAKHSRVELRLGGDIGWSLLPLGLELNAVSARLDGEPLLQLQQLIARVDLFSLLRMQPQVHSFVLSGLDAQLSVNAQGVGNWQRILHEADSSAAAPTAQPPAQAPTTGDEALAFNVQEIRIDSASLSYRDARSGQALSVAGLQLDARDIALDRAFPLKLAFTANSSEPALSVEATLSTQLTAAADFQTFSVSALDSRWQLAGEAVGKQPLTATLAGELRADLGKQRASLKGIRATLANIGISTDLEVQDFGEQMQLQGQLQVAEFSPRALLAALGQPPIVTRDPTALSKLALNATLGGEPGNIRLEPLALSLDSSRLRGALGYRLADGHIDVKLQADQLNLDRYQPPETEETAASGDKPAAATAEGELLPLQTLRQLNAKLALSVDQLVAANARLSKLSLNASASGGAIDIQPFSGQLYGGGFNASARIDARSDKPEWKLRAKLDGVQALDLLKDVAELTTLAGTAGIQAEINSSGNRVSALREQARGQVDFSLRDGLIDGTSMTALACEGIAAVHQEGVNTTAWPKQTAFDSLAGRIVINGHQLNNNALKAQLTGMALEGSGSIDASQLLLDYKAGLRIEGPIHDDPSCRINERLVGVVIPVKCKGPLAAEGESPCRFDSARFRDTLKDLAKAEAKRKVDKAVDHKIDKLLGEKKEGETEEPGKEAARKLLKDIFR